MAAVFVNKPFLYSRARINRKMIISFDSIKNMIPYSRARIKIDLNPVQPKEIDALVSVDRASSFKDWLDK